MPINLQNPASLVLDQVHNVQALYLGQIVIDLGPARPIVTVRPEAEILIAPAHDVERVPAQVVVVDPGAPAQPGDLDADPPVPAVPAREPVIEHRPAVVEHIPAVMERRALPAIVYTGDALTTLMADATARTI